MSGMVSKVRHTIEYLYRL